MHSPGRGPHDTTPVLKPKNVKNTLKRMWWYLSEHKIRLFFVFLLVVITSVLTLVGPYLIGKAIDNYIIPRDFNGLFRL